jgi:hypothetical protein
MANSNLEIVAALLDYGSLLPAKILPSCRAHNQARVYAFSNILAKLTDATWLAKLRLRIGGEWVSSPAMNTAYFWMRPIVRTVRFPHPRAGAKLQTVTIIIFEHVKTLLVARHVATVYTNNTLLA